MLISADRRYGYISVSKFTFRSEVKYSDCWQAAAAQSRQTEIKLFNTEREGERETLALTGA